MAVRRMRERSPSYDWPELWSDGLPPDWAGLPAEDSDARASLIGEWVRDQDALLGIVKVGQA